MNPNFAHRTPSARRDGGYAITEVLIAAVLLVLVSGAFLQLVVGSTQAQASVKVRQKQQAVSEGLIEQLRVDSKWTKECTEQAEAAGSLDGACVVQVGEMYQDADFAKDPNTGVAYRIKATATAVDSRGDGIGARDEDGSPVDFFEVKTVVEAPEGSNVGALTSTSVVDPFSSVATGSLHLDVCAMPVQTDERLVVSGCESDLPLDASSVAAEDRAAYDALPVARRTMQVDPVRSQVRLTGLDTLSSVTMTMPTDATGKVAFDRVKPGRYKVSVVTPPDGLAIWTSKSIPEMTVSIEPYQTVDALVAYRRERGADYTIRLESGEPGKPATYLPGAYRTVTVKLLPWPAGRAPIEDDFTVAGSVDDHPTSLTFEAPYPGLYRAQVVNGSNGIEQLDQRMPNGTYPAAPMTHLWLGTPSFPAGVGADRDGNENNDHAAVYRVTRLVSTPPADAPAGPGTVDPYNPTPAESDTDVITYPKDPFVPADPQPDCRWVTVASLNGAAASAPGRVRPGIRTCAPCGNITVNHQALNSTVTILCGRNASCRQDITLSDGRTALAVFLGGLVAGWGGNGITGGSVTVACYQDASCTQSGVVAGNLVSTFTCLPTSQCTQVLKASSSWSTARAGGSADVECHPQARCTQTGVVPPNSQTRAHCYPRANCAQTIANNFTWGKTGSQLIMECHPDATCAQDAYKTNNWDGIFGNPPAGPLWFVCRPKAACDQEVRLGSFANGFDVICHREGTCKQTLQINTTSGTKLAKTSRQTCFPKADCEQFISRSAPSRVLDQTCYPPQGNQEEANNATDTAPCDLNGSRVRKGWFGASIETGYDQRCSTQQWCRMTMSGGGWFSFGGLRDYLQRCISYGDCSQTATRYADLLSGVRNFYQECQSARGKCTQNALVVDDSIINFLMRSQGERRQVCDSRTRCNQSLRGSNSAFGAWGGNNNAVYQLCNRKLKNMGAPISTVEPEPEGDFDSENGGTGGA